MQNSTMQMRRVPHSSDVYIGTHTSVTNATWESMGKDVQNKQTNNKKKHTDKETNLTSDPAEKSQSL